MKRIDLTITALSPLAIGQRKPGGSVSEALDYIPGTVIRGAIAKEILSQSTTEPTEGDDFYKLFLEETAAVFRNAYPAIAQQNPKQQTPNQYQLSTEPVRVVPASALSAKTSSGFKPEGTGVFDSLIDSFCAREQGHFYVPNDLKGNQVDSFSGFYSKHKQAYLSHSTSKRLLTRVGINRKRATAQDEILYSVEVINESQGKAEPLPTVFSSSILIQTEPGSDSLAGELYDFLQQYCKHLRVGGSASRGLGKVRVAFAEPVDVADDAMGDRLKTFNQKIETRWNLWSALGNVDKSLASEREFFSLTLQSDAILSDNWRRTTTVSPAMLAPLIELEAELIRSHAVYSSYDYRSGWNAAWGLPKDTELVTKMGSAMLFSIPRDLPQEQQSRCYEALAKLEKVGIGSRCSEGFGQVSVCDDFHLIMREAAV